MPKSANQKIKILYLMRILLERTDDEHGLTLEEISNALLEYGVEAERKTLYDDLEVLRVFGLDIEKRKGKTVCYHVVSRELLNDLKAYATKNGLQGMELVLSDNKKRGVQRKIDSLQNWVINHRSKFTETDRTNDVKEGYKPKVDKITFHGLRHYYTQKRGEWLEKNHIRNAKRNLSESLGHHRESITKIYSNKK